jgi:EmrB/QacA subfamily drug resistance transporter
VATFTFGSMGAALSDSAGHLLVFRAVQGLGAAFVAPLSLTILARAFPPQQRAAVIGLWSGVSGLGLAIGPLVGGAIVNGITWNAIFWLNVPVGVAVVALGWLRLEESWGERQPLDLPGLVLAAGGLFGITFGLVRGNALGWESLAIITSFLLGGILLAAFLWRERSTRAPMLDLRLFAARSFSVPNAIGFLMSAGMFGSIFLLTLFVQQIQGATPLEAGLKTMPWTGTIMIVAPLAGILAGRIGSRPVVLVGMALQTAALLWIGAIAEISTPYPHLLPAFILGGMGMGLTFAPLSSSVVNGVAAQFEGQASGGYNAIRELGGVFGVAILGAVFQHMVTLPTPAAFVEGFHTAVFVGAGIVALGTAGSLLLPSLRSDRAEGLQISALPVETEVA